MDTQKQIDALKAEIEHLKQKRITQENLIPDVVKSRHIGEGPRFVRSTIDRPTVGENGTDSAAIHFNKSTGVLSIWDDTQWLETTLS